MVARIGRAPIGQHADETPIGDMRPHRILRHIGQPESSQRRIEHRGGAVEHKLPLDAHPDLAATFLEFPRIQPAMRRQAQIDAGMRRQVLRRLRPRAAGEIRRRTDDRRAHVGPMRTATMSFATISPVRTPAS